MRKIIAFITILGFITTTSLGLAATKKSSQEGLTISGKVAAIEDGLLSLKEPNGQIFKVAAESDKLKGIKVDDRVTVKEANGWVASIKKTGKAEMKQHTKQTAEKKPAKKEMTKATPMPTVTPIPKVTPMPKATPKAK